MSFRAKLSPGPEQPDPVHLCSKALTSSSVGRSESTVPSPHNVASERVQLSIRGASSATSGRKASSDSAETESRRTLSGRTIRNADAPARAKESVFAQNDLTKRLAGEIQRTVETFPLLTPMQRASIARILTSGNDTFHHGAA